MLRSSFITTEVVEHRERSSDRVAIPFRFTPTITAPPHGHLKGNGYDIPLGQNGKPLDPDVELNGTQQKIVDDNIHRRSQSVIATPRCRNTGRAVVALNESRFGRGCR